MIEIAGNAVVSGIQLGNVWIGVQPALGVEGDPMRLLFDRYDISLQMTTLDSATAHACFMHIEIWRETNAV